MAVTYRRSRLSHHPNEVKCFYFMRYNRNVFGNSSY